MTVPAEDGVQPRNAPRPVPRTEEDVAAAGRAVAASSFTGRVISVVFAPGLLSHGPHCNYLVVNRRENKKNKQSRKPPSPPVLTTTTITSTVHHAGDLLIARAARRRRRRGGRRGPRINEALAVRAPSTARVSWADSPRRRVLARRASICILVSRGAAGGELSGLRPPRS